MNGVRGQFARICVRVNLEKPLIKKVYLRKLEQSILYEGINTLYFACGRIRHKRETCPYVIKETIKETAMEQNHESQSMGNAPQVSKEREEKKEIYGEWMVVS